MTEDWMSELTKQERLDKTFMDFALSLAELSHCCRVQVGAVITLNERVVSTGYNGTPGGYTNCDHHFESRIEEIEDLVFDEINTIDEINNLRELAIRSETFREEHGEWSKHEVHGEQNAILHAAKAGSKVDGGTIYTTISPCMDCAKAIIVSGIVRCVYLVEYDRDNYPLQFLKDCGVKVEQWTQKHSRKRKTCTT